MAQSKIILVILPTSFTNVLSCFDKMLGQLFKSFNELFP